MVAQLGCSSRLPAALVACHILFADMSALDWFCDLDAALGCNIEGFVVDSAISKPGLPMGAAL